MTQEEKFRICLDALKCINKYGEWPDLAGSGRMITSSEHRLGVALIVSDALEAIGEVGVTSETAPDGLIRDYQREVLRRQNAKWSRRMGRWLSGVFGARKSNSPCS